MKQAKTAIVVGSGLGGLSTALRLARKGLQVTILEQFQRPGGRLNQLEKDGFRFDTGPSFFSMSYEFKDYAKELGFELPFEFVKLDPLYSVRIAGKDKTRHIYTDLDKLAAEFADVEPDLKPKLEKFLEQTGKFFHDVDIPMVKTNFDNFFQFLKAMFTLPPKYLRKVTRTVWAEIEDYFDSEEVKTIFSLVAFFLGATPFDTPAVYTLLSYTELKHDGYYNVKGGMYEIVKGMVRILEENGVKILTNTKVTEVLHNGKSVKILKDQNGNIYEADIIVVNADAASFRGQFLNRKKYSPEKLDKKKWTMAPFCIYLGIDKKLPQLDHHNYFLGDNFREYSKGVFQRKISADKPYYYVNVLTRLNPQNAPEGHEGLFILWPVPDRRFQADWSNAEELSNGIIKDLSSRIGVDLFPHIVSKTLKTPTDWENDFSLYKGSGLGLAHDIKQIGAFRPSNKDEELDNLYYVGASTTPGTGLPMVLIGSGLVMRRIENDYEIV